MDLYDIALQVTDEVFGAGTYARLNQHHPDPGVQAAIENDKKAAAKKRERAALRETYGDA